MYVGSTGNFFSAYAPRKPRFKHDMFYTPLCVREGVNIQYIKTQLVRVSAFGRIGTQTRLCLLAESRLEKIDSNPTPCILSLRVISTRAYALGKTLVKKRSCATFRFVRSSGKYRVNQNSTCPIPCFRMGTHSDEAVLTCRVSSRE